jgi:hypothetical protein
LDGIVQYSGALAMERRHAGDEQSKPDAQPQDK